MNKMNYLFALIAICCSIGISSSFVRQRGRPVHEMRSETESDTSVPAMSEETARFVRSAQIPSGKLLLEDSLIGSVLRNQVRGSKLIDVRPRNLLRNTNAGGIIVAQQASEPIDRRLPDNYTLILQDPYKEGFNCQGRNYGYYADPLNNCQIFHVCLNFQQIWPQNFTTPLTYQFSFICPEFTIFSQDSMTCNWSQEAIDCNLAERLYSLNEEFFKVNQTTIIG